ncbi:hypothetical protein [Kaarinaea lacus]
MKNQQHMEISDRRSGDERRTYETDLGFPFVDSHGLLVTEERRKVSERRTNYDKLHTNSLKIKFEEQTA